MATKVSTNNVNKPAPRWYRITKKIIYLITTGNIFTGTLTRVGISANDQLLIIGWTLMIGEILGSLLANGETYEKTPIEVNATIVDSKDVAASDIAPDLTALGKNQS